MAAPAGLIWLASFPKSGNTWFRIFLANLAAGAEGPADINDLERYGGYACNRDDFEAEALLDSSLLSHDDIDALRPRVYDRIAQSAAAPRWMKVHDAYTLLPGGEPLLGRGARAALYLVRDPRDVAISFAHHLGRSIDDAIALMAQPGSMLCGGPAGTEAHLRQKLGTWSSHVTGWLDQRETPVHLIRYEDLIADPAGQFGAALAFAGYDSSADAIAQAIHHADFAELQRQERKSGFAERKPGTAPFFRAGRAGGWREGLTDTQRRRIETAHAEVMERLGYALG